MNENCVVFTRPHYDVVLKAHLSGWSFKAVTRSGTPHWSTWQMDRETIEQAGLQTRRQSDTERNDHLPNKSKRDSGNTFISNVWPAHANMNMQTRRSAHASSRTFARFVLGLCSVLITPFSFLASYQDIRCQRVPWSADGWLLTAQFPCDCEMIIILL